MKCDLCRRLLLATQNPDRPSVKVQVHLARCSACRHFQKRLLQVERHVPLLPVPRPRTKARLLQRILVGEKAAAESATPTAALPAGRGRRFVLRVGAVAASVALIACGIYLGSMLARALQGPQPPVAEAPPTGPEKVVLPERPLMVQLVEHDLHLAEADTPRRRVEALASAAGALHGETQALSRAAGPREMQTLARLYERVVRDGVVARARGLPAGQRRQVLEPILVQLAREAQSHQQMAQQAPAATAQHLQQMAQVARTADKQLRALLEETP